ncbi:hypothetical protein [Cohaesibacter gelatinilyticus]|uniref:Uncharacterized protein n=1 Tax=Cohaesibacter gelatinilyticus TaxID=372072 RepID=A0A285PF87_9HYPH|nr:hypothetical protein [Cohaesibacter gelatinilyticus]SNZ20108.1 hypothetical protein SAMN06265368_3209 [Cohaesibacter gelatinilyticus]
MSLLDLPWPLWFFIASISAVAILVAIYFIHSSRSAVCNAEMQHQLLSDENAVLRQVFLNLAGATEHGTLKGFEHLQPEQIAEDIRQSLATEKMTTSSASVDLFVLAADLLRQAGPPMIGAVWNEPRQMLDEEHDRIIKLFEHISSNPEWSDQVRLQERSEVAYLFAVSLRMDAFSPDTRQAISYSLAGAILRSKLAQQGVFLLLPPPLSLIRVQDVKVSDDEIQLINFDPSVAAAVLAAKKTLSDHRANENCYLVIDCKRPGWISAEGTERPHVAIANNAY